MFGIIVALDGAACTWMTETVNNTCDSFASSGQI